MSVPWGRGHDDAGALAQTAYLRLQPWCPQCSDGGGGQDVETPTPVLLPHDDRERV